VGAAADGPGAGGGAADGSAASADQDREVGDCWACPAPPPRVRVAPRPRVQPRGRRDVCVCVCAGVCACVCVCVRVGGTRWVLGRGRVSLRIFARVCRGVRVLVFTWGKRTALGNKPRGRHCFPFCPLRLSPPFVHPYWLQLLVSPIMRELFQMYRIGVRGWFEAVRFTRRSLFVVLVVFIDEDPITRQASSSYFVLPPTPLSLASSLLFAPSRERCTTSSSIRPLLHSRLCSHPAPSSSVSRNRPPPPPTSRLIFRCCFPPLRACLPGRPSLPPPATTRLCPCYPLEKAEGTVSLWGV
jgi:hypothetical protein